MHICDYRYVCVTVRMCRSENYFWELVFSFQHASPKDPIQVLKLWQQAPLLAGPPPHQPWPRNFCHSCLALRLVSHNHVGLGSDAELEESPWGVRPFKISVRL